MQLYHGLPIITNKILDEERKGIPHHLLGTIPLDSMPWDVTEFKQKARATIADIRSRGKLPILVGGTHYYVDALLFQDALLDDVQVESSEKFPILQEPTEVLLAELRNVDPVMAERWHPNDRRKIQRSLEIYLQTGKPASEHYAEQQKRRSERSGEETADPWENILFWVFSEREALCHRLDARVDKMLHAGLLDEVRELKVYKKEKADSGQILDMTKGIWQSIGFKQLEPFVEQSADVNTASGNTALDDMKTATRRYANYQTRWIRLKQVPRLKECGQKAVDSLYLLDSTNVSRFSGNVVEPAASILTKFLAGSALPPPIEISPLANEMLTKVTAPAPQQTIKQRTCEACQTVLVTEEAWKQHVSSAGHRRVLRKKKRLALVPVDDANQHSSGEDDVEVGNLFD